MEKKLKHGERMVVLVTRIRFDDKIQSIHQVEFAHTGGDLYWILRDGHIEPNSIFILEPAAHKNLPTNSALGKVFKIVEETPEDAPSSVDPAVSSAAG